MTKPSLRMLLTIPSAQKELYEDIEVIPVRERAERMRTLAAIGLASIRGRSHTPAGHADTPTAATEPDGSVAGGGVKPDNVRRLADSM